MARKPIPEAAAWKWGAKCSKTADGEYIDIWEHPTLPKPTRVEVDAAVAEYEAHMAATEYRRRRGAEYPPLGDQLDAVWKGGAEAEAMRRRIADVKARHPRP